MSALIIFFSLLHYHLISSVCGAPLAPALYVFGDSLLDSGNNNILPTVSKANFEPYGVDFAKGDTGRFSNGRLVPDFIAEFLGLPYPPPCLSFRISTPVTGLNYASASCGILSETGQSLGRCLSLDNQIDLFQRTVESSLPNHFKGPNELMDHLSKSILLYSLGARKVVMFEIGPIGCTPSMTRTNQHNGKCVEESNQLVSYFNDNLLGMLKNLTSTLPNSIFVRGHVYWLGYDAIMNPSKYGLVDTSNPCCETWANGTSACIPNLKPCPNPDQHFFFDGYHLTESVYSLLASHCIGDGSVCSPTLKELVTM
ncbi:GDSL esterase/lipase [Salix suchowensis]|nr:GDSL esterase/lipase [Salix suchowensis]